MLMQGEFSDRDQFAAQAMQSFIVAYGAQDVNSVEQLESLAVDSYRMADAMLKARKTKTQ